MGKNLFIAEKPSVAMEFAKALDMKNGARQNGYVEDDHHIVTWCVGHLIEMSYPEKYDPDLKKWSLDTIPFVPDKFRYEVIPSVEAQYDVVASLLNRKDVGKIYYSGDSAREGEYIQRLVRQMAGHNKDAEEYRVWIDSQTKEEILNGIKNAKPLSAYDDLSDSAYARAIEDYLVGINFSRALSLKYAQILSNAAGGKYRPIQVGRVMSCVLGMVVERERLIRSTQVIPFYSIKADLGDGISADWKIVKGSRFDGSPECYKDTGLLQKAPVNALLGELNEEGFLTVADRKKTKEKKNAPLLFNLAELQSECTKQFRISPAETLQIAQTLYEKKLTTYPRTDARFLTTAVCKVISTNISGLSNVPALQPIADKIITSKMYATIGQSRYTDDSKVSDHYAIIPTGQGFENLGNLSAIEKNVYMLIARRFLSIFYPPAEYDKAALTLTCKGENFTVSAQTLSSEGWLEAAGYSNDSGTADLVKKLMELPEKVKTAFGIREGKSQPPKRYTTGSMILAMENAGNLIEDPELREQIKGSGIGTSATRADTISKLEKIQYIKVNPKTQQIQPDKMGEMVYDILHLSVPQILAPKYTASWETGLSQVAEGKVSKDFYLGKIYQYIRDGVHQMKATDHTGEIKTAITSLKSVYPDIGSITSTQGDTGMTCPFCGKPLRMGQKSLFCTGFKEGCKFVLWNTVASKSIPENTLKKMAETLTLDENGNGESQPTNLIKGFKSKAGTSFDAKLKLSVENKVPKVSFVFDQNKNFAKK